MIFVGIEKHLESEEAILTADGGSATKLKSCPVKFKKAEGTAVHDGGENDIVQFVCKKNSDSFLQA
jgi:hypothetical protein